MSNAPLELSEAERRGVEARRFRDLMGCFATGVTVLTLRSAAGESAGVTVNALTSVSLDPPLLLVCLHRDSRTRAGLEASSGAFVLNVLAADQDDLSRRFAADVPNRFDGVGCVEDSRGIPALRGSAARIECQVTDAAQVGDHTVYYALVTGGRIYERPTLLFYRGRYRSLPEG